MNASNEILLFQDEILNGERFEIDGKNFLAEAPQVFYRHKNGEIWAGDSVEWLKTLPDNSVDIVFADPPYNIKKASWDDFDSHEAYVEWSMLWMEQASRALKPNGTMYVCGFSEILADLKAPAMRFFSTIFSAKTQNGKTNTASIQLSSPDISKATP